MDRLRLLVSNDCKWQQHKTAHQPMYRLLFSCNSIYDHQTTSLEGRTKRCVYDFIALFNDVRTRCGLRTDENSFKNAHATLCSIFQNLRLGSAILQTVTKQDSIIQSTQSNRSTVGWIAYDFFVTILQTVTKQDSIPNPPNPIGRMHGLQLALYQS
jgi:hypothetical protein